MLGQIKFTTSKDDPTSNLIGLKIEISDAAPPNPPYNEIFVLLTPTELKELANHLTSAPESNFSKSIAF